MARTRGHTASRSASVHPATRESSTAGTTFDRSAIDADLAARLAAIKTPARATLNTAPKTFSPEDEPPAGLELSGDKTPPQAKSLPVPIDDAPAREEDGHGHTSPGAHASTAVTGGQLAANVLAVSMPDPLLADPFLALAADVLDDLEKVRIANENRLRQLTRSVEDSDGEMRGFGLMPPGVCEPGDKKLIPKLLAAVKAETREARAAQKPLRPLPGWHPDVWNLCLIILGTGETEHQATLNLQRMMRRHPLGPWAAARKGVGEKQFARLLATTGDPYIRPEMTRGDVTEPSRPRMVSELWAFAGLHVIRTPVAGQRQSGTHATVADDGNGGDPGHVGTGDHTESAGVAPRRTRGQRSNWSTDAKTRVYLIAESCIKQAESPYRPVYDDGRQRYAGAVHAVPCARCGPSGTPAKPGSSLSAGHQHARAMRLVMKEILRDLWIEARRIHGDAPL